MSLTKTLLLGAGLLLPVGAALAVFAFKPDEKKDEPKPRPVVVRKADREAAVKGVNALAFDLFHKLRAKEKGNLFLGRVTDPHWVLFGVGRKRARGVRLECPWCHPEDRPCPASSRSPCS
ncbi:MAG: hypothetical protein K2W96_11515 [Gemmataceae bacterium]|nr:hypothetical protein [Gemmataceae bacterium]